ncbi:hypothetical protein [Granulicella sp. dw_53]|uniref:hypothetical protein n=1 Tax=Granulicella sp. dw_53 TaxID=2719792 RepID=UPI0031F69705
MELRSVGKRFQIQESSHAFRRAVRFGRIRRPFHAFVWANSSTGTFDSFANAFGPSVNAFFDPSGHSLSDSYYSPGDES